MLAQSTMSVVEDMDIQSEENDVPNSRDDWGREAIHPGSGVHLVETAFVV